MKKPTTNSLVSCVTLVLPDQTAKEYPRGILLQNVARDIYDQDNMPMIALVNKIPYSLLSPIDFNAEIEFWNFEHKEAQRAYRRTACLIMNYAIRKLFPEEHVRVEHSLQGAYYCTLSSPLTRQDQKGRLQQIASRMRELVQEDIPLEQHVWPLEYALKKFQEFNAHDKVLLFRYLGRPTITVYGLKGYFDYFYGPLLTSTGLIKKFTLLVHPPGFFLRFPTDFQSMRIKSMSRHEKYLKTLQENEHWAKTIKVNNVGTLNQIIASGDIADYIAMAEARHEKRIGQIADIITSKKSVPKVILISGPSASGKTTFSKRLAIHLRINGLRIKTLSLDNYFVDRDKTPLGEDGKPDFESLYALDLKLLNRHLSELLAGKVIELPHYNFPKGIQEFRGEKFWLEEDESIIIEGIHGLNPWLTRSVATKYKFKIYVSALTQMNLDNHNRVPTTNVRMIRRTVRDHCFRGYTAKQTLLRWPSISRGEYLYVFPHQEKADEMFNSALMYELAVLKTFAEPLLRQIPAGDPSYPEARRLLTFLDFFLPISLDEVSHISILREFVGGSWLRY